MCFHIGKANLIAFRFSNLDMTFGDLLSEFFTPSTETNEVIVREFWEVRLF